MKLPIDLSYKVRTNKRYPKSNIYITEDIPIKAIASIREINGTEEVLKSTCPLAFVVHKDINKYGLANEKQAIYYYSYKNELYAYDRKDINSQNELVAYLNFVGDCSCEKDCRSHLTKKAEKIIIRNGQICKKTSEPVYRVETSRHKTKITFGYINDSTDSLRKSMIDIYRATESIETFRADELEEAKTVANMRATAANERITNPTNNDFIEILDIKYSSLSTRYERISNQLLTEAKFFLSFSLYDYEASLRSNITQANNSEATNDILLSAIIQAVWDDEEFKNSGYCLEAKNLTIRRVVEKMLLSYAKASSTGEQKCSE